MRKLFFVISILVIVTACSSESGSENNNANYNKEAMLTNWADNIIIPAFTDYQANLALLGTSANTFTSNPNANNLDNLRSTYVETYKTYQHIGIFDIGKATDLHLLESANTYPTDTENIEFNITDGEYNLNSQAQFSSQGFPALDYMLYGLGNDDETVLTYYSSNINADGYKQYLTDLIAKLKEVADAIVNDWNTGYRAAFINNSNAVTGSLNQMANNFVKNFEKDVRAPKVGIPSGMFSNGTLFPDKVEAYYQNNLSKTLLIEAVNASKDFFNGRTYGTTTGGSGLKEFLDAVGAQASGENLSTIINNQYNTIISSTNELDNSFSEQITNDNSKMLATYDALQQNVVYLKVDMISALSLTIDYVDGDGD